MHVTKRLKAVIPTTNEGMSNVSLGTCQKLFEALFPGSSFSAEKAPLLVSALKSFADSVAEHFDHQSQEVNSVQVHPKRNKQRDIDFSQYQKRYIALEIAYQGFDYSGFARQDTVDKTIEEELFAAMKISRLVPDTSGWKDMIYSRGGRTDKGVSAAGQVVALEVRSQARIDQDSCDEASEYDYSAILNRILSPEIRILGWKTVERSFSARFSAKCREYKYFFIDQDFSLNLPAMQEAANYLVGEHDFRNFCKADIPTVKNFSRKILSASLRRNATLQYGNFSVVELHIRGTAFLWHQIRCIAAVLQMIGKELESPTIVRDLLDIGKVGSKPQYSMASDHPLLLYGCLYEDLPFNRSRQGLDSIRMEISSEISSLLTKATLLSSMKDRVDMISKECHDLEGKKSGKVRHVPLLDRVREPTIEERLARYGD